MEPGPLWFIAEPRRTDAALVDPVSLVEGRQAGSPATVGR